VTTGTPQADGPQQQDPPGTTESEATMSTALWGGVARKP